METERDNLRRAVEAAASEAGSSPRVMVGVGNSPEEAFRNSRPISAERELDKLLADHGLGQRENITLRNIDELFRYQPWNRVQQEAGDIVREALVAAGKAILRNVPPCASRDAAIQLLVDTRMKANAAISFNGRF